MKYQSKKKDTGLLDKDVEKRKLFVQVEDSLNTLNQKNKNASRYVIKKNKS